MKKSLLVLTIAFTFCLFLVNSLANASNVKRPMNLFFIGTGEDCLGTNQYEYELNIWRVGRHVVGELCMIEDGELLGKFRLQNGKFWEKTLNFTIVDTEGYRYHFSLLWVDDELDGGVVELKDGPDEVGLTGLTRAHFQLVP